jgi:hypothetical protein
MSEESETRREGYGAIRAIVLDVSAFPNGILDVKAIRAFAKLAQADENLQVWIPEVILLESARHAYEALGVAQSELRRAGQSIAGIPALPKPSLEEVVHELREQLADIETVSILGIDGNQAIEAIKDQILQRPPGKRSSSVTTGAADSLWLRLARKASEDKSSSYAIVSEDKDVKRAYTEWRLPAPVMFKSLRDARAKLLLFETPNDDLVILLFKWLGSQINSLPLDSLQGKLYAEIYGEDAEVANEEASAANMRTLAGMSQVEVDRRRHFVTGTAHVLADVTVSGAVKDPWEDRIEYVSSEAYACHIRIPFVVNLEEGRPSEIDVDESEAAAFGPDHGFEDAEDAFSDCIDALSCIPGLSAFEWAEAYDDERETTFRINGVEVVLHIDDSPYSDWAMYVAVRDVYSPIVRCSHDPSQLIWDEDETLILGPQWRLSVEGDTQFDNPLWVLPVFLADHIFGVPD